MDGSGWNSGAAYLLMGLALVACATGCQSNGGQASFANPFLSRDRVPPPATRSIVPGSAAPYYPGDPVPVLQGAAPVQQPVLATPTNNLPPITPITAAPAPSQTYVGTTQGYVPTPMSAPAVQASAQSTVVPAPQQPITPMMTNPVQPAVFNQPVEANNYATPTGFTSHTQQAELADTGFSQPALPAAADPHVVLESSPPSAALTADTQQPAQEQVPWRSPHGSAPMTATDGYQPVALQAVASPYPQGPMEPQQAPRIRLPGGAPDGAYMGGHMAPQTLAITELPPHASGALAAPPLVAPPAASAPWQTAPVTTANFSGVASDGFRPRTSMR